MPFNVNKCHIQVGTKNKQTKKTVYEMNGVKLENVQCVKDLGVTIASNLKFSQQCKDAAGKANRMLGFYKHIFLQEYRQNSTYVYQLSQTQLRVCGTVQVDSSCKE